jgi:hypothetical protein
VRQLNDALVWTLEILLVASALAAVAKASMSDQISLHAKCYDSSSLSAVVLTAILLYLSPAAVVEPIKRIC